MIAANLLARKPGKIICMESLGELVQKWRLASGLKPADLARLVGGTVKRQHIEQLEQAGARTPRYIADLARAMRSTVDDLLALRMPPPLQDEAGARRQLSTTATALGGWFDGLPPAEQRRALAMRDLLFGPGAVGEADPPPYGTDIAERLDKIADLGKRGKAYAAVTAALDAFERKWQAAADAAPAPPAPARPAAKAKPAPLARR